MWRFIDVLKKEQDLTNWIINQKLTRQPRPPQQKKWKDYGRQLNFIILSYDDFQRMDYLNCVGSISCIWLLLNLVFVCTILCTVSVKIIKFNKIVP